MPTFADWVETSTATEDGWYAILFTYGEGEDIVTADLWQGDRWSHPGAGVAYRSPSPFASREEALDWANLHDPDW